MAAASAPVDPGFRRPRRLAATLAALTALLTACATGPDALRPTLALPTAYKEAGPWKTAEPRSVDQGQSWWQAYQDPVIDGLMQDAGRANQTLRQAEAQYREARALVDAARAGLFPTVGIDVGAQRALTNTAGVKRSSEVGLGLSASWEPDWWGGVRRHIESNEASAQAVADDLAAARLSIQAALAQDYFQLRTIDQQRALYASTIEAYTRAWKLTQAQHAAGVALLSDVAQADTQLRSAQAAAVDLQAQRSQLEHAIAVLTGRAPADFNLPARTDSPLENTPLPVAPVGLPSTLLERRPDIAAAERRAAMANADIGVARAAYFPSLTLSASRGFSASGLGTLFDTPSRVWSLGAALAQTLFDGGLRRAQNAQAVAAYDAAVAAYKQTVLSGFQQVEDQLALLRLLDQEAALQAQAVQSARLAERLALSQYRAGTASYLSVVVAQTTSLANQRSAVQLRGRQLAASVSLIVATGGGWQAAADLAEAAKPPTKRPTT